MGVSETGDKSLLLEFFGDTPNMRIIDFLLENRLQDFTKTEIAKGAKISWASLFNYWGNIEKHNLVKLTRVVGRARLYQLNEKEPVVEQLKNMEMLLMKQAADAEEESVTMKVKVKAHKNVKARGHEDPET
ncbi:MAG: hypothetical protein V1909_03290 [Candidatus Micrarchaeota archaeon]